MGLGKSLQAISLLWTLLKQGPDGEPVAQTALILCPSSLVQNWVCELQKWLGDRISPVPIADSGNAKKKILHFEENHDVLIISYDQLKIHCDDICKIKSIGLLIADEGHRLKNAAIKTTQAAARIPTQRRIILSGTPIQNDLKEFYSMVSFVNPKIFENEEKFRKVFEEPVLKSREPDADQKAKEEGLARIKTLTEMISHFILRRTFHTNMQYLPPKTESTLFFKLTSVQVQLYEELLSALKDTALLSNVETKGRGKSPALSLLTTLKKLCNSPDLLVEMSKKKSDCFPASVMQILSPLFVKGKGVQCNHESSSKITFLRNLLLKIINESPDRVVIVSMYKQTLEVIATVCNQCNIKFLQLDGGTTIKKRQTLVDRINDPKGAERVMLLSSKAGGVGLNLVGANHLVLFDGSWNPSDDAQVCSKFFQYFTF
jgi:DNA repair and recombination protein RAD54 and RAD54-like protein